MAVEVVAKHIVGRRGLCKQNVLRNLHVKDKVRL